MKKVRKKKYGGNKKVRENNRGEKVRRKKVREKKYEKKKYGKISTVKIKKKTI